MPQPFSNYETPGVTFFGSSPGAYGTMHALPAHQALGCIAANSLLEHQWLRTFIVLSGGLETDSTTVYLALKGDGPKKAALAALAEAKLTEEEYLIFTTVQKISARASKERDKLAHWLWGFTETLPDALLLTDPRYYQSNQASSDATLVYFEKDFEEITARIERARWLANGIEFFVNYKLTWENPYPAQRQYEKLCAEPEIRDVLDRQNREA